MGTLIKDHYALGLHPKGYDLLIQLIDLELGLSDSPESLYVLGFILDGWTQREVARHMKVHHSRIQQHVRKARQVLVDIEYL
jgi:UDP-2,3-diacylglucosamine pyrophosphatase LpxH